MPLKGSTFRGILIVPLIKMPLKIQILEAFQQNAPKATTFRPTIALTEQDSTFRPTIALHEQTLYITRYSHNTI